MRILDCFTFFNELDLLEFRLSCLYPHVHRFVISEANTTFSGRPKDFVFKANVSRFSKFLDKIDYLECYPKTLGLDFKIPQKFDGNSAPWVIENEQRNFLAKVICSHDDDTLAIVSDIDEIWDPHELKESLKNTPAPFEGAYLRMGFYYYFFNCKGVGIRNNNWESAYITKPSFFKSRSFWRDRPTPSNVRGGKRDFKNTFSSGWHFSYLGGAYKIIEKIESFSHQELNTQQIKDYDHISRCVHLGLDPFARPGHNWAFVHMDTFPDWIKKEMYRYPIFYKESLISDQ